MRKAFEWSLSVAFAIVVIAGATMVIDAARGGYTKVFVIDKSDMLEACGGAR